MEKKELIKKLEKIKLKCQKNRDIEAAHYEADDALIEYINDEEIEQAYDNVSKWYS